MFSDPENQFLDAHRWAVLTHLDREQAPASSVVAFARDGSQFVVSTPGATAKRHRIEADGRVNLCVISNREPFDFIAITGQARVSRHDLERRTRLVFAAIAETGWQVPDDLDAWLEKQQRVMIEVEPLRYHAVLRS
ncbi:MAG: pyridoxamine 5'-phosphate oxidase family protein [Pseudomonadota bacterium]